MIYHIVNSEDWNAQASSTHFAPQAFELEGFIHCCTKAQLPGVLQRYYSGQSNLLLLHLDESKLESTLTYEKGANEELFPHLFGRINMDAVILIEKIS